ncbi:MAG: hypothetical protein EBZ81_16380 [Betaproteobacteria bacterium]|nr:hypothetical protein [Betaproteobacteria bacterium]
MVQIVPIHAPSAHEIAMLQDVAQRRLEKPPHWFVNLAHLDQLLATWEWRSGPTPWLVMRAKGVGFAFSERGACDGQSDD